MSSPFSKDCERLYHQINVPFELLFFRATKLFQVRMAHFYGRHISAATQWDLVNTGATTIACAHEELINQAAQSRVVYNDDTTMKVLQLTRAQRAAALADDVKGERTGVFTSGIVATDAGRRIALFFTARFRVMDPPGFGVMDPPCMGHRRSRG